MVDVRNPAHIVPLPGGNPIDAVTHAHTHTAFPLNTPRLPLICLFFIPNNRIRKCLTRHFSNYWCSKSCWQKFKHYFIMTLVVLISLSCNGWNETANVKNKHCQHKGEPKHNFWQISVAVAQCCFEFTKLWHHWELDLGLLFVSTSAMRPIRKLIVSPTFVRVVEL